MTIEELKALSDAATPGHWLDPGNGYIEGATRHIADVRYRNGEADRAFIVAAVNHVREVVLPKPERPISEYDWETEGRGGT